MPQRVRHPKTPAEWQQLDAELASEKAAVLAEARESKTAYDAIVPELRDILRLLKVEREAQGLSLMDIESRCGLAESKLSHLENDPDCHPTLAALRRYASAVGKKLTVRLTDQVASA